MSKAVWLLLSAVTIASLVGATTAAQAQWGTRVGLGYVVNAPNQYVGLSGHFLTGALGGLGLYLDGKIDRPSEESRDNFQPQWTAEHVDDTFGDQFVGRNEEYVSFNAALMRPITPELIAYLGAGLSDRRAYVEYYDLGQERGTSGFYWVEDTDAQATGVNVLGGAFFRISRNVFLQFGVEAIPRGATVGASYSLPLGR